MIEIQHGCIALGNKMWKYVTVTSPSGNPDDVTITEYPFASLGDDIPVIGDFIVGTTLVKRDKPKVNSDWSKWKDKDLYGKP